MSQALAGRRLWARNGYPGSLYPAMVASNLTFDAHKVPAYLRGLVQNRARADGQIQRLTALLEDLQRELQHAHAVRDSCDALLSSRFASLDMSVVDAIGGWRGRYGKRGVFSLAMRELLQRPARATALRGLSVLSESWEQELELVS